MRKSPRLAPSILAADFADLGAALKPVEPLVERLHIDVMDGHFVPNISIGVPVVRSLRAISGLYFECHLMMTNPDAYFTAFREAGADMVQVHIEVFPDPVDVARRARAAGLEFGLVLNPPTPFAAVEPFVELADELLIMTVHPGFGGQGFMEEVLPKVETARKFVDSRALATDIEVDGGITPETAALARAAGADVFVAGTSIFRAEDPAAAVGRMKEATQ
jgi:ribulose-phosphate 3-epimerase